jgi:hypothetical protein
MDNKFYTYLHLNAKDGRPFYVGKGKNDRLFSDNKRNKHWQNIVNKHGFIAIKFLSGLSEESAFETERSLIAIMRSVGIKLCNMTDGGEGPAGMRHSEETKRKWSIAKLGKKRGSYSAEHRQKISDSQKGKVIPDETRQKISNATKIAMQSPQVKQKMIDAKLGKSRSPHSQETKEKMSLAAKKRWSKTKESYASQG